VRPPSAYRRRVLVAVTGLSPQIVTETLYALATTSPAFVPTEVHLITTRGGAEKARLGLLSLEPGWFHRLRADYALPPIEFSDSNIHVLRDAAGIALDDIRTPEENKAAADFITDHMRTLTSDSDCALHVSIAGGRKTMGFFLGYALSLYGREQDRLSHVLVSEPFESTLGFYYPTPYSKVLELPHDRGLVDTAKATVTLAEIPFVSLRHGLPESLLTGNASFSQTVDAARNSLAPPELLIDVSRRRVRAANKWFRLPPAELALLSAFARARQAHEVALPAPKKEVGDADWARRFLRELRLIAGAAADLDDTEHALRKGMDGSYFSTHLSKLRRLIRRELGPGAGPFLIDDNGTRPRRYQLTIPPESVHFDIQTKGTQQNK